MMQSHIHSTVIIEGEVQVGEGTTIGPYCYLRGPIIIGKNNKISSHVVIGEEPEHRSRSGYGVIRIGDQNIIRELTVIHRGTGEKETEIGHGNYLMDHCHVSHDVKIGNDVTLSHNVVIAGHCRILDGATLGISTMMHQWSVVGSYVMAGMGSVITKDIPPFVLVTGNPAYFRKFNEHVFQKLGVRRDDFYEDNGKLMTHSEKLLKFFEQFYTYSKRNQLLVKL